MYSHIPVNERVTIHASIRYMERIMEIPLPEGKEPNVPKMIKVGEMILRLLLKKYPQALEIGNGEFRFPEYDFKACMTDGKVTTIKEMHSEESKQWTGGIMNSGSKRKKGKKIIGGPREKTKPMIKKKNIWNTDW